MKKVYVVAFVVLLAVVVVMFWASQQQITAFAVTAEPVKALEKAQESGKPVFLEFYGEY